MNYEELKWFLFDEYIDFYRNMGIDVYETHLNYTKNILIQYKRFYHANRIFRSVYPLSSLRKAPRKILFQNDARIFDSIAKYIPDSTILGANHESLKYILGNNISYYPIFDIYANLYEGLIQDKPELVKVSLNKLKKSIFKVSPDAIVLNTDALPAGRALVMIANELHIPSIEIQHGIYARDAVIPTGRYVDYIFVWGKFFKKLYIDRGVNSSKKIKILGYPFSLKKSSQSCNYDRPSVVYIGQNVESYDKNVLGDKIITIKMLTKICDELNLVFVYRPHPGEKRNKIKEMLPGVIFTPENESLYDTISKYNIFISFSSTALVEAILHSKIGMQLKNFDYPADNFQNLGICPSFANLDDLRMYLKDIINSGDTVDYLTDINQNYIKSDAVSPSKRFIELVGEILNN